MKSHTRYLTFQTRRRRELVRITDEVAAFQRESGIAEGLVLVSAMHITAAVFVNDDEPGLHADMEEWIQRLAPGPPADPSETTAGQPSFPRDSSADRAERGQPSAGPDYRHHQSGEDNGDAHLKNLLLGHQVIVPVTKGQLDLGPWQQIFYYEFDGRRPKRVVLKALGE